jgi:hypothetical protein
MKLAAPVETSNPQSSHIRVPAIGVVTWALIIEGAEKMPEPIWSPTMRARQLRYVRECLAVVERGG